METIAPQWEHVIGIFAGGLGVMWWVWTRLSNLKKELLGAIKQSRIDGDAVVAKLQTSIEKLSERQRDHETHVEREFIRRQEVEHAFEKLSGSIDRLEDALNKRLGGIEDRLPPKGG